LIHNPSNIDNIINNNVVDLNHVGLSQCIKSLRYYLALQSPDTRTKGLAALDIVDGIIMKQPLLPLVKTNGEGNDE